MSGHRRWSGFALVMSVLLASLGAAVVAPAAQAATITLSGITCDTSATVEAPTFVAKADNLEITAADSTCQGFDIPNGSSNFTGSSGSFASASPFGTLTLTNRKQQSALTTPLAELRKSGSSVVITVVNSSSARATTSFTAKTPPNGQVGAPYDYTFQVDGSPVQFTRSSGTLPPGLTLGLDGRLQGTASSAGSYTFNVNAYNLSTEANTLSGDVTVVIDPATSAVWSQRTPANGVAGSTYGPYTFIASGGTEPYSYSVAGALPAGLTLSAGGVLSGTPIETGTFSFVVSKAGVGEDSGTVSITIQPPAIDKVTICHRTRATTNPYVLITVSVNSVIGSGGSNGHDDHNTTRTNKTNPTVTPNTNSGSGPFVPGFAYPANRKWWGDIIPPFSYVSSGVTRSYAGLNWGPDWTTPNPASGGSRTRDNWLEDAEFAAAIPAVEWTAAGSTPAPSVYGLAVQQCMSSSGAQSAKSLAIDTPENYFKVAIENGEDSDSVREDLEEQQAIDPGSSSPRTIPSKDSLETRYNSTAKVTTNPASTVTQTAANLNGTLKSGTNWTSWKYEWSTDRNDVRDGVGSSYTYNASTDPGSSVGPGQTNPVHQVTGLTCGTTYYFRIVGTDNTSAVSYGLVRTFRTDSCSGGGSNNGGGSGSNNAATPNPSNTNERPLGEGRPQRVILPPAANPGTPTTPGTNNADPNGSSQTPTGGNQSAPRGGSQTIDPSAVIPPPPGDEWVPEASRLEDPETGEEKTRVVDEQGTWVVNPRSGAITFTPAPSFVGTAVLNVRLTARSGLILIQPIRVRVGAESRILVIKGGVPRDILGGVLRLR